ncbi:hypothetical protein CKA32_000630 [Geitlerinema sp. FC II]|nr:hypothetical protein CKA32_000630 [Geitlerinema sp. FC II]
MKATVRSLARAIAPLFASVLWGIPEIAVAQFNLQPLSIEATATRGQAQGVVSITNVTEEPFRGRVYAEPFTYSAEGFQLLSESPMDLTPYLVFAPREFVIEPGQTRQVRTVARLLPSLPEGEYRAILFVENLDEVTSETGGSTVGIRPRLGATFFVRYGDLEAEIAVGGARFDAENQQFVLNVTNSGTASAKVRTTWQLESEGAQVSEGYVGVYTVVPGNERNIEIRLPEEATPLAADLYELSGELTWDDNESLSFEMEVPAETTP